jgi:hypothetical protein
MVIFLICICICAINYQHKAGASVSHSVSFSPDVINFSRWHKLKKTLKVSAINSVLVSEHSLDGNRQILHIHTTYLLHGAESFRSQPVNFAASQEIPRIYGTRKFLTLPTSARHLSLS